MAETAARSFEGHVQEALQELRGALTELHVAVGADPLRPQQVSRRFGVNRNLSWKISRIIQANEPREMVPHLPGSGGLDILLDAFAAANAPPATIDAVRRAFRDFEAAVATHAGDRATFDLMLDSMSAGDGTAAGLERCRKLAFQGNSGVWGIQGRVRLASHFVAPSADGDGMLDFALLGGLVDLRRLRPDVSAPLFMRHRYNDDGSPLLPTPSEPIEHGADANGKLMLMHEFSSPDLPPLHEVPFPGGTRYELQSGPVGNTARMSWIFGWMDRRMACMYRDEINTYGEHVARIFVPAEALLCDLFLHADLPFQVPPRVSIHGQTAGGPSYPASGRDLDRIPFAETVQEIATGQSALATTLIPRYPQMVGRVLDRLGWSSSDFRCFRFVMKYPPMPSVVVLRYDLPERPDAERPA